MRHGSPDHLVLNGRIKRRRAYRPEWSRRARGPPRKPTRRVHLTLLALRRIEGQALLALRAQRGHGDKAGQRHTEGGFGDLGGNG